MNILYKFCFPIGGTTPFVKITFNIKTQNIDIFARHILIKILSFHSFFFKKINNNIF